MDFLSALLLGLIQGFTEWLPISSSGHLVIAQTLLGISTPAEFDIVLMFGTIAALLLYFRDKITWLVTGALKGDKNAVRFLLLMVLAGIPTGIVGFAGRKFFKSLFASPFVVSLLIVVTGIFLFIASRKREQEKQISEKEALLVGLAQGIAVAPGISRSGSTIGTALLLGVKPQDAAEFSFLIGVPAMLVASLLEFDSLLSLSFDLSVLAVAVLAAFISGYASIKIFMELLKRGRLEIFAYYCLFAGLLFALLTFGK